MPLPIPISAIAGDGLRRGMLMLSSSFKVLDKFAGVEITAGALSGALPAVAEAESIAATVVGTVGRIGEPMVSTETETAGAPVLTAIGITGSEGPRFPTIEGGVC